jgi:hypothetical protein
MKKILLTINLALLLNLAIGQTINSSNIVSVGDTIVQAEDVTPNINLGTAGTGNNWNFSSLLINSRDTTVFFSPSVIPCASSTFPLADYGFIQDTNIAFLSKSASSLELLGISNWTICAASQDSETVITFPSSYNTSFMDTARTTAVVTGASVGQPIADSIRFISVTYIESNFDASGTITTPYGIFSSIRQNLKRTTNTEIYAKSILTGGSYSLISTENDTAISHQYWSDAANTKFPIVNYEIDASGNLTGSVIFTIKYAANPTASISKNEIKSLKIFPNPTTNQLTLDVEQHINQVIITNIAGKRVFTSGNTPGNVIDVSYLLSGVYIISIQTDSYTALSKFIKE